jgi:hypothetical protein
LLVFDRNNRPAAENDGEILKYEALYETKIRRSLNLLAAAGTADADREMRKKYLNEEVCV